MRAHWQEEPIRRLALLRSALRAHFSNEFATKRADAIKAFADGLCGVLSTRHRQMTAEGRPDIYRAPFKSYVLFYSVPSAGVVEILALGVGGENVHVRNL